VDRPVEADDANSRGALERFKHLRTKCPSRGSISHGSQYFVAVDLIKDVLSSILFALMFLVEF
jgi:hypothetical protein